MGLVSFTTDQYVTRCEHCGAHFSPRRPDARYCTPAHRTAAYRARRQEAGKASPSRHTRSGLQVSYPKAVEAAYRAATIASMRFSDLSPRQIAEAEVRSALSPAQRARLEARP